MNQIISDLFFLLLHLLLHLLSLFLHMAASPTSVYFDVSLLCLCPLVSILHCGDTLNFLTRIHCPKVRNSNTVENSKQNCLCVAVTASDLLMNGLSNEIRNQYGEEDCHCAMIFFSGLLAIDFCLFRSRHNSFFHSFSSLFPFFSALYATCFGECSRNK